MADPSLRPFPNLVGDRYTVERELGRGGMATVFLARDLKHDRHVAVKVLDPELAAALGGDRFLREIRIEAHLRHPHIAPLLDSGETDGFLYYVMPYVEGESLRQRLAARGRLEIADALRYWRDTVDAIAYAHRHGVVHRDIKPENVLLAERHASVVDFGVGKALGNAAAQQTLTKIGVVVGTPTYMAPEQATGATDADHRVDIYALGTLAYEMLAGSAPFAELTPAAQIATKISAPPPDIRELRAEVPAELARLINRCLEPDPAKRWQSADELLAAVESVSTPAAGTTAASWHQLVASPRRKNALIAAAALGAVLLTGATYAGVSRGRERRWARETAIAEIRRLADANITDSAFLVASRARAVLSDAELNSLWKRVSVEGDFHSAPPRARVWWTAYRGDTNDWHPLGTTPLEKIAVPAVRSTITLLLKVEKSGYRTSIRPLVVERSAKTPTMLDSATDRDTGMVHVRGGAVAVPNPTRVAGDTVAMPDFLIDRYEVTNAQFKQFVRAGGYSRKELWDLPPDRTKAETLWRTFGEKFRDATGRPGPASWQGADVPPRREKNSSP
jgi:tRNA A-37 threonylcarbamoyl transferase component Bud32